MGVDISLYPERRVDGEWRFAGRMVPNEFHDPQDPESGPSVQPESIFDGRNRSLFAILGAPCNPAWSTTTYEVIAPTRGLPPDCSTEVAEDFKRMSEDPDMAATASWLTVAELHAFDWHGQKILKTGVVDPELVGLFPPGRKGFPWEKWPKDKRELYAEDGRGARVYWEESYADSAGYFLTEVLPKLEAIGRPDDVRIVYWFDW